MQAKNNILNFKNHFIKFLIFKFRTFAFRYMFLLSKKIFIIKNEIKLDQKLHELVRFFFFIMNNFKISRLILELENMYNTEGQSIEDLANSDGKVATIGETPNGLIKAVYIEVMA